MRRINKLKLLVNGIMKYSEGLLTFNKFAQIIQFEIVILKYNLSYLNKELNS